MDVQISLRFRSLLPDARPLLRSTVFVPKQPHLRRRDTRRRQTRGSRRTRRRSRAWAITSPRRMRPMPSARRSTAGLGDVLQRHVAQDGQLRAEADQQLDDTRPAPAWSVRPRRGPRPAPPAAGSGCERDALAPVGRPSGRSASSSTRCITPTVTGLPQTGQTPSWARVVGGSQTMPQARWPSKWYLPSSGKNSMVPRKPRRRVSRRGGGRVSARRTVAAYAGSQSNRFASRPSFSRRVRVGVGDQGVAVERRHAPVHRRVGREAGLQREDVRRQIVEALRRPSRSRTSSRAARTTASRCARGSGGRRDRCRGRSRAGRGSRGRGSAGRRSGGCRSAPAGLAAARPPRTTARRRGCGPCASGRRACRCC